MQQFIVYVFPGATEVEAAKDLLIGKFYPSLGIVITTPTVKPAYHPGYTKAIVTMATSPDNILQKIKEVGLENFEKGAT